MIKLFNFSKLYVVEIHTTTIVTHRHDVINRVKIMPNYDFSEP